MGHHSCQQAVQHYCKVFLNFSLSKTQKSAKDSITFSSPVVLNLSSKALYRGVSGVGKLSDGAASTSESAAKAEDVDKAGCAALLLDQPEVLMRFSIGSSRELACATLVLASASVGTPCVGDTDGNSGGLEEAGRAALPVVAT